MGLTLSGGQTSSASTSSTSTCTAVVLELFFSAEPVKSLLVITQYSFIPPQILAQPTTIAININQCHILGEAAMLGGEVHLDFLCGIAP